MNTYAFVLIGDICQYWMDLENMKLSSPYFPQNYFDDGSVCDWFITAPEGNIISLEFHKFDVNEKLNLLQRFPFNVKLYILVISK